MIQTFSEKNHKELIYGYFINPYAIIVRMINTLKIYEELKETLEPQAAKKITEILGTIYEELRNTVTKEDFKELKEVVAELAEAQKKTEIEVAKLAKGLQDTRGELGGLSKSMSYAFENEAFRKLPAFLKENYGIEIKERLIREDIGGKEINIFGIARKKWKRSLCCR